MSEIKVQCIDQAISFLNTPVISSGNVNYDTIHFDFCSRWDGYAKTAIFYRNKDEVYYQLLENDSCIIPNEVLGEKGVIYIGVFGTQGDKTITSQVLTYRIQEGAVTEDLKPSDPTPDIYAQIISRYNDYDTRLAYFENRFNGSVGDAEKLGGQLPEYYASAESVRNIQTSYQADFSTEGWYRVAEFSGSTSSNLTGDRANTVDLIVKRTYSNTDNEYHILRLRSTFKKQEIVSLDSKSNTQIFTKARITYEFNDTTKKSYFELYYKSSSRNSVRIIVNNAQTAYTTWRAISPTITEESQSGITILTTYDIPANASPVTDLDLAEAMKAWTFDYGDSCTNDDLVLAELNNLYDSQKASTSYEAIVRVGFNGGIHLPKGGNWKVIGHKTTDLYGYQIAILYGASTNIPIYIRCRSLVNGTWTNFDSLSTAGDLTTALAGYFKNTGGNVSGDITAYSASATTRGLAVQNSLRKVSNFLNANGEYYLTDVTNGVNIISSSKDGATNTFNGTATGNLKLTGGTVTGEVMVKTTDSTAIRVRAENANRGIDLLAGSAKAGIYLPTSAKWALEADDEGNVKVNGTATGNVRLESTGTQIIKSIGLVFDNITDGASADDNRSQIAFRINGESVGALGVYKRKPIFYDSSVSASRELLHSGNSAKVVVSETPLTASGSIRVW